MHLGIQSDMERTLVVVFLATTAIIAAETGSQSEVERAREILETSARAYKNVETLRDTLSYAVNAPGSEQETKKQEYGFGPGRSVFVKNALLEAVALDKTFYLTQSDVPDKYVSASYDYDFGSTLRNIAGAGSLFEPPPLAMHEGKSLDACIDTFRFNLLEQLRIAGCRVAVAGDDGKSYDEVQFTANNGELTLRIDRQTHFLATVSFQVKPAGAPEGFLVRVNGTFSPRASAEPPITFNAGSRSVVNNLTELASKRLAPGSPAPDFALETLDGKKIALQDLRGSVVLLDFWATWCVPCWKALKETQSLANWATAEKLPVKVLAVNTLEQGSDASEKLKRVQAFWRSQGFVIPTLLDSDSKMFKAFQSPGLPSMVLISQTGTILRYHEGLFPEMGERLKQEVRESLNGAK
ncbi:MAG TPA: TlpA disulfide reductase family protein [Candidatus Dormibacteraeota bacterium]|nr:TlpA disulfide reductase family protein [Candidatus Dormibacteraeota bacterium]